ACFLWFSCNSTNKPAYSDTHANSLAHTNTDSFTHSSTCTYAPAHCRAATDSASCSTPHPRCAAIVDEHCRPPRLSEKRSICLLRTRAFQSGCPGEPELVRLHKCPRKHCLQSNSWGACPGSKHA